MGGGGGVIPVAQHGHDPQLAAAGRPSRAAGGVHAFLTLLRIPRAPRHTAPHTAVTPACLHFLRGGLGLCLSCHIG